VALGDSMRCSNGTAGGSVPRASPACATPDGSVGVARMHEGATVPTLDASGLNHITARHAGDLVTDSVLKRERVASFSLPSRSS
jgi:hypothetical protein